MVITVYCIFKSFCSIDLLTLLTKIKILLKNAGSPHIDCPNNLQYKVCQYIPFIVIDKRI